MFKLCRETLNIMKKAMPSIASLPKWVMSEVGHKAKQINHSSHDKANMKELKKKSKSNIGVFHVKTVCICM